MAKQVSSNLKAVSKLIISKDEFAEKITDRINKGKELLNLDVKIISSPSLEFGYRRDTTVKYDDAEQAEFYSVYNKWDSFNIELLKQSFSNSENDYRKEYENSLYMGSMFGSNDIVNDEKKTIKKKVDTLESFIERIDIIPSEVANNTSKELKSEAILSNKVFIVHGHDSLMKEVTARTLTQLGLEPIILHEQVDGGKTIIEKFEKNSSEVSFAVILLTADDEGKSLKESEYQKRARQNVVFEMGYFIGKLHREKVFLLLEKGVEKPGDLDGIVYTSIDSNDGWKFKLVKELKACGYNVSADSL